jgi:hypothetical protein
MKMSFPIIPPDRSDDLHHLDIGANADLVLFIYIEYGFVPL